MTVLKNKPELVEAMKQIQQMTEDAIVRITENEFVNKLLPFLTYEGNEKINLAYWADIAGSVFMPIHVVKGKEILFTVPAICKRDSLFKNNTAESMFDILSNAKLKTEVLPTLGDNYLIVKLNDKVVNTNIDMEELKQWDSILKRYGHKGFTFENKVTTNLPKAPHDDVFDGQYDEL